MYVDPQATDHPGQQRAAGLVDLDGHEPRCHLDDMRRHPERPQRVGRLQAQQTTTDDHGVAGSPHRERRLHIGADAVEVIKGAVYVAAGQVVAGHGRHERVGTGRQHQGVVPESFAGCGHHGLTSRSIARTGLPKINRTRSSSR